MLHWILTILQFVSAVMIILLVLVQRGKGAEAGAGFGAGASGTVFGARGAGTALSRATGIIMAVFMLNSLALAYVGTRKNTEEPKTLLDTAGETGRVPARTPGTAPAGPNGGGVPTTGVAPGAAPSTGAAGSPAPGSGSAGAAAPAQSAPQAPAPSPTPASPGAPATPSPR